MASPEPAQHRPWHGWGDPVLRPRLSAPAERLLRSALGAVGDRQAPVALDDVALPPSKLPERLRRTAVAVLGDAHVRVDHEARVRHAAGSSYADLLRLRRGEPTAAPDAVLLPGAHDEVQALLSACARERVAVVPFGGGTSVVGGVAPDRGPFTAVVALALQRMHRVLAVDAASLTATVEAGIVGAATEAAMARRGLTLGHFPQSHERATIGGYVATRSVGQASSGYGRIDQLVTHLRAASPAGELALGRGPASAAGPDLRALLVGSEGALGVITEVGLRLHPAPPAHRHEAWSLPTFDAGLAALQELAQAEASPHVARLSDPEETRLTLAQAGGRAGVLLRTWLRARGHAAGCLAIVGWDGAPGEVRRRRRRAARALRGHGGLPLGRRPGEAWRAGRFTGPSLRDELLDRGLLVETLETAAPWSTLSATAAAVGGALRTALAGAGVPALVGCHVSHLYPTGASLYFTVLGRPTPGREIVQWQHAKRAATEAIVGAGATVTHHHGVGTAHRDWMEAEIGTLGVRTLVAAKAALDPEGILNPGKLLPPGSSV